MARCQCRPRHVRLREDRRRCAGERTVLGAGTVGFEFQATVVVRVGVNFVVAPNYSEKVLAICAGKVAYLPGIETATEAFRAYDGLTAAGYQRPVIKFFPGDLGTPKKVKHLVTVSKSVGGFRIMVTGGGTPAAPAGCKPGEFAFEAWKAAGAAAVGMGSNLLTPEDVRTKPHAGLVARLAAVKERALSVWAANK